MSERKRYSPEYKREAVELVRRSGSSCRQIALDIGIRFGKRTLVAARRFQALVARVTRSLRASNASRPE